MLVDALIDANRRSPGKLALDDGRQRFTYRRLTTMASVLASVFGRETQCKNIGLMLPASTMFPATLFGALWGSKTAVPLNFLLNSQELTVICKDAGLDLVVTIQHFAELASKLPVRVVFLEDLPLKRMLAVASLKRFPAPPAVEPSDTAVILYTSGTTAEPKGVELTHQNLYSNAHAAVHSLHIRSDGPMLNNLPPFHVFGLTGNVLVPVLAGTSVYALPRFNPLAVVRMVGDKKIGVMMAIPSMFAAILKTKSTTADSFKSLYLAVSGGEPLPDNVRIGFQERFGVTLRQGYGLTETSPVIAASSVEAHRDGTVGRPIQDVKVRIVGESGEIMPTGEEGEIVVNGPGVMKGYYNKPEETRAVLDQDGWFKTGDIGRLDADGFLSITGRAKEMFIIGGENVFPREIESVLETHEGVLQAAVVPMQDDLRGEVPVAFVIPQPGATIDEQSLRAHAKASLAGFKVPRRVIIKEDLPTGPTGKLLKRKLRELL